MSSTNKTTNYELPIFVSSDSPKWLVDWNGAMTAIDSAIYQAKQLAETAGASASSVAADLASLASTVSAQGTSISTLVDSLTTLTGTVNTITSLIGNGEPTTTDKTIIGAINELNAKTVNASAVGYDNTTSGLTADDAQEAIDENAAAIATINSALTADYEIKSFNTAIGGTLAAPYEIPSDGYITMSSAAGTTVALRAVNEPDGASNVIIGSVEGTTAAVFVRKGMLIYQTVSGTGSVSLTFSAIGAQ